MNQFDYFKKRSKKYDLINQKKFWYFSDEILWYYLEKYISDIYLKKNEIILLDAGCGTGKWSKLISEKYPRIKIYAIDINEYMLSKAKEVNSDNIEYINGDILKLPFIDHFFDIVISIHALPFTNDIMKGIDELVRVGKNEGFIGFTLFNAYDAISLNNLTDNVNKNNEIIFLNKGYIIDKPLQYFTFSSDFEKFSQKKNYYIKDIFSYPSSCTNGVREKITSKNHSISDILAVEENYQTIFTNEIDIINKYKPKDRGMYIFCVLGK